VTGVLNAYATPLGVSAIVQGATAQTVTVVADIWLPAVFNNANTTAIFQTAIQNYFANFPIGGISDTSSNSPVYTNILPIDGVIGAISAAAQANGITTQNVVLVSGGVGGMTTDVSLAPSYVAVLTPAVPTVNLIPV
jgi:hypothetical protein